MPLGFLSDTDHWWWCLDHQKPELNPPGINGGAASEGHRWVGPYQTEEGCERSGQLGPA